MYKKLLLFIVASLTVLSFDAIALELKKPTNSFLPEQANTQLSHVQKKLSEGAALDKALYQSFIALKAMQKKAKTCATEGYEELKEVDGLLNDTQINKAIARSTADYEYLKKQRTEIENRVASCQVFAYKVQKTIEQYAAAVHEQAASQSAASTQPVWGMLNNEVLSEFSVSTEKLYQNMGFKNLTRNNIIALVTLLAISLILAKIVYSYCQKLIQRIDQLKVVTLHTAKIVKRYVFYVLPAITLAAVLHSQLYLYKPTPVIIHLSYAILAYLSIIALVNYSLFLPTKLSAAITKPGTRQTIFNRFLFLITAVFVGYLGAIFLRGQALTTEFVYITRSAFTTLLIFSTVWLCWAIFSLPFFSETNKSFLTPLLKAIFILALIMLTTVEWMGYHDTSIFALRGLMLSALFAILSWGIILLIERTFTILEDDRYQLSQMIRHITSLKPHRQFIEFYMLRIALYILFAGIFLLLMMQVWGATLYQIDLTKSALMDGFPLLGINIVPIKIAAGLVTFSVIHMLGRIYATRIANRSRLASEQDSQVAISSVVNYASFTIALIIGLLVAGVNFTGLAIIAGALSVGIGFGLQNIVNNFLSGLILLIQKPVKPGDRVVVGETEGFIRRIRVLSTQIKTLSKEDVIIPNSSLIANPVTNYMFRDSFWRVTCKVGVAYGSDTALVKQLLMEAGSSHPDVLQEEPNKPAVHFKEFGDSALLFELWVIIADVNKKYHVASDLHFTIDTAFRKHGVVIAFPQRDLHIKEAVPVEHFSTSN